MPTLKEQGYDFAESIWRGVMLKAGTPKDVIDSLMSAIEKMKQTKEWQDFSRLNMQSSVTTSLDDMQKKVRNEVAADRAFLQSTSIRK